MTNDDSKLLPSRQRVGENFLVRVFQDAARGDAAGQPRYLHGKVCQEVRDKQGGAIPFDGRVRGQADFAYAAGREAGNQSVDRQLVRADAIQWSNPPEQDVVEAAIDA